MSDEDDEPIPPTREQAVPQPPRGGGTMQLTEAQLRGDEPVPVPEEHEEEPIAEEPPRNPFEDAEVTEPDLEPRREVDTQDLLAVFDDATDIQKA